METDMNRRAMFKSRAGQTLIEVTMATIVAAITAAAVFSVILSSSVSRKKSDKKELSAMLIKEAQQTLQLYVSADSTTPVYTSAGTYWAPNLGGRWSADSSNSWALTGSAAAPGTRHDISALMNTTDMAELRGTAASCVWGGACHFVYYVQDTNCSFGTGTGACKTVSFDMKFAD
ncbi:MAG: hypothetical protein A2X35_10310 [Elusimicrobia bacterium GWA2_61_42]|nr:MAG: hypothetical protein A2X35_10310 [Elusimicrobia bacterium GWA2_61_42]OGR74655.1 MAG: hypothetical protein A2X38_02275 [Elusimicrobia bacterium GWC2_61_25]